METILEREDRKDYYDKFNKGGKEMKTTVFDTEITCPECSLSWSMTADCSEKTYCPYCGKEYNKRSGVFRKYEKLMKEDLTRHQSNPSWLSCTEDYSYYYGIIDALSSAKLITAEETGLLHDLKKKFEEYRNRHV